MRAPITHDTFKAVVRQLCGKMQKPLSNIEGGLPYLGDKPGESELGEKQQVLQQEDGG